MILMFHGQLHLLIFKSLEVKYKKEVKQIIKAGIPQEELVLFSFQKSIFDEDIKDFKWTKKNEFRYKNEMYDIIKTELKSDSVYFYCFHDLKESKLFKNLDAAVSDYINNNSKKQNELISLITFFNQFYSSVTVNSYNIVFSCKEIIYEDKIINILKGIEQNINPPPNFLFDS